MLHTIKTWLLKPWQAIKVWGFRKYYLLSNAMGWRGKFSDAPWRGLRIPVTGLEARLYESGAGGDRPLIVYFHGGGWVIGDLRTHHPFCQALRQASGCSVIAIDYHLAPEHPFPAAQDDALAATRWIAEHMGELGANNARIVIAGDSAGGHLATCTCLEADGNTREKIIGEALIYPAVDHYTAGFGSYIEKATGQTLTTGILQWFWNTYLGDASHDNPGTQRAFPLRSDGLGSLPPTLLVTAENDPLRDEGLAYADKLREAGVPVKYRHFGAAEHGFACSHGPTADFHAFMNEFGDWLNQLH